MSSSTEQQTKRILDALQGAFAADAASMGTHWIYDPEQMKASVPSLEEPEFKNPPTPNYYSSKEFPGHYGPGMLSPYGEQMLFVTEHCAAKGLKIAPADMSAQMKDWAESFGGRRDHAMDNFLKCATSTSGDINKPNCGDDDDQAHCFTKAVAVTCLFVGGKLVRRDKVEQAIRVHQDNDTAVAFGLALSNILNALLLGSTLKDALAKDNILQHNTSEKVTKAVEDALNAVGTPLESTAAVRGRSCHLPESFIIPLQACLNAAAAAVEKGDDVDIYASAIRENILASGDTCSRSIMMGAILAVANGGCPASFSVKMDKAQAKKIIAAAQAIAKHAATTP
jgi:hypothetical protein